MPMKDLKTKIGSRLVSLGNLPRFMVASGRKGKQTTNKSQGETKEKMKITVGETIRIFDIVTVIRIRKEAAEELDKLPKDVRNRVLDEAMKITLNTDHPYDVTLEDVLEAKKKVISVEC
jgi:hypothetical protein